MSLFYSQTGVELHHGNCLKVLRELQPESISATVVDPPYGLGEVKNLPGLLEAWMSDECDKKHIGKSGFMSREWDAGVPSPRYWKEVYKVMKPGAHLLCFASTRTWDLMSLSIRLAGFENRDTISHEGALRWYTGQGFPKGHDVSAAIDRLAGAERETIGRYEGPDGYSRQATAGKRPSGATVYQQAEGIEGWHTPITAPSTEEAKKWSGWNCALKPAWEVILVFRRPLEESSIARQVLSTGTGALAIDKCRVSATPEDVALQRKRTGGVMGEQNTDGIYGAKGRVVAGNSAGRFPANLLLSHVSGPNGCQRIGSKRVKPSNGSGRVVSESKQSTVNAYGEYGPRPDVAGFTHLDPDGLEEVESFECVEGCPILELDRQGGNRKSGSRKQGVRTGMGYHGGNGDGGPAINGSEGSPARFFQQFHEIDTGPGFFYSPKSSKRERNLGLEGLPDRKAGVGCDRPSGDFNERLHGKDKRSLVVNQNNHPTVKPLALMRYLVRLVTPPNGTVLDCFAGSGTTGLAAILEGANAILVEAEEEYCQIAAARIAHAGKEEPPKPRPLKIVPRPAEGHIEAQASLFEEFA